jgi:hypothetical protein
MTSEVLSQAVGAGATITFGQGRIFNLLGAASPVTIVLEGKNSSKPGQTRVRTFKNIPAGSKFTAREGEEWTFLRLTSAAAQNVTLFVGDDDMSFNNAVTVTGVAVVAVSPSSTFTDTADTVQATGTQTAIAANLARKRITIGVLSTSAESVRVSSTGGAARGIEIQAGTFTEFDTTGALIVRNDNTHGAAASATWYAEEES